MHKIFVIVVTLLFSAALQAQPMESLYQAVVPVQNQASQIADLKQALLQVIVKLTGRRASVADFSARITEMSDKDFMRLVKSVEYRNQPAFPGSAVTQSMSAAFFSANVDQFIGKIPRWSSNRPLLLIWAVLEEKQRSDFVNSEQHQEVYDALKTAAWQRGVPVLFPLLDIDDRQALSAAKLASESADNIIKASQRYGADLVMSVMLRPSAEGWQSEWRVHTKPRPLEWSRTGLDLSLLLQDGIFSLTDLLANQYVKQFNASPETFEVVIESVSQLNDFSRVQKYLDSLDILSDAQLLEVDAGRLHFRLTGRGGRAGFAQATQIGSVLNLDEQASTPDVSVYRLAGY